MIRIYSTSDIPLDDVSNVFAEELRSNQIEIDRSQFFFKSMEPPSWIHLVVSLTWWQAALVGAGSAVMGGFFHEMGRDAWKNREAVGDAVRATPEALWKLADRIVELQTLMPPTTRIRIGFPLEDELHPALYSIEGIAVGEIANELGQFGRNATLIQEFLDRDEPALSGPATITLTEGGGLILRWLDRQALKEREVSLGSPEK